MTAQNKGEVVKPKNALSIEELRDTVTKVDRLVKSEGIEITQACVKLGIKPATYYNRRRSLSGQTKRPVKLKKKPKPKLPSLVEIPAIDLTPRLWMLYGTPHELAHAMRVIG